ncbi:MAG: VIT and VWA domain-containing protein [Azoarcus sp.]|nr:VIT and VWA domain-containing protein [Azoarcus sp.]
MLRNALMRFAQMAGESLATKTVTLTVPDIPQTLRKGLSAGCKTASTCLMALAIVFSPVTKAQTEAPADKTESPYFYIPGGDAAVDALPLKATDVDVRIAGVIADVTVTQTYRNEGTRPIEAKYLFPGSTRAAIHAMNIRLGDRIIIANIREKNRAKKEYEQAKSEGKTASLLEQHRPNVFQMNVANILPGDEVRVELRYTELMVPESGQYRFVFPTVVGPRYASPAAPQEKWTAQPTLSAGIPSPSRFNMKVSLDTPISIKQIGSPSHAIEVAQHNEKSAGIRLAGNAATPANNRDFILDYRLAGDTVESGVLLMRGQAASDENFFLAMVEPPKAVASDIITPRDYIFVVDVSGSMHGFPLNTAKAMLRELLSGLRPMDTFNVLLFESNNAFLHKRSVPATQENIQRALSLIDNQNGGGGTELIPALQRVYAYPGQPDVSRTIVVVTDGNVRVESQAFQLVRKNLGAANLFAFGIGGSVNRHLIEGLARAGMGEPFVITRPEDAAQEAERFRKMISSPVLTGVQAHFEGVEVFDTVPGALPDVLAERPVVLFGKWVAKEGHSSGKLVIKGHQANGTYQQELPFAEFDEKNNERLAALRHLWARQRIAELSDEESITPQDEGLRIRITELGLKYSLLTQHTSFVAVDRLVRNPKPADTVTVDQPLPLPEGVSNYAVGGSYNIPGSPEPEALGALAVVFSMMALIARHKARQRRCRRHLTF